MPDRPIHLLASFAALGYMPNALLPRIQLGLHQAGDQRRAKRIEREGRWLHDEEVIGGKDHKVGGV